MQTKAKPAPATQAKRSEIELKTASALRARLVELQGFAKRITVAVIDLEKGSVIPAELDDEMKYRSRPVAIALLNGDNEPLNAMFALNDVHQKMALLKRAGRDIREACDIGEARLHVLEIAESAERWRAAAPEHRKNMRAIWKALCELERAQQARDKLFRDAKVSAGQEGGVGWVFVGRLGHTHSQVYNFGRVAVSQGWISETEFQKEYENAKA